MAFISLLISWALLRFGEHPAALQDDRWFVGWVQRAQSLVNQGMPTGLVLAIILLIPVLLAALLIDLLGGWLFGLVEIILNIVLMLYACGRGSLRDKLQRLVPALDDDEDDSEYEVAARDFGVEADEDAALRAGVRRVVAYQSYEHWFAPAFWFLLLGAPGAVFYRLTQLLAYERSLPVNEYLRDLAISLIGWLDVVPVRIWAFGLAVIADFSTVLDVLKRGFWSVISTEDYLDAVQTAALGDCVDSASSRTEFAMIGRIQSHSMTFALIFLAILYIAS